MRESVLGKTTRCVEDEGEAAGSYSRASGEDGAKPHRACQIQRGSAPRRRLQQNAHFRDKRCQKRRQRASKTVPLAPRGPRDREPLFLGLCSQMPQILLLAIKATTGKRGDDQEDAQAPL